MQRQAETNQEEKSIVIAMRQKTLEEVITERLDQDIEPCPYTLSTPIIPYTAINTSPHSRFTRHSFELTSLLHDMLVMRNRRNPLNRKPIAPNDIGTELTPDRSMIDRIDTILHQEGFTRNDLLAYFGISRELYDYLLQLNYRGYLELKNRRITELSPRKKAAIYFGIYAMFSYFYRKILQEYEKNCIGYDDNNIYQKLLGTFVTIVDNNPNYHYGNRKTSHKVTSNTKVISEVCEIINSNFLHRLERDFSRSPEKPLDILFQPCEKIYAASVKVKSNSNAFSQYLYQFETSWDTQINNIVFPLSGISTYLTNRIFSHSRDQTPYTTMDKALLSLFSLAMLLVALDAVTDCFGLVSYLGKRNVIRDACARACNKGSKIIDIIDATEHIFQLSNESTTTLSTLCTADMSKTTAAWLNIAVPPMSAAAIHIFGHWSPPPLTKAEKEFKELEKNNFVMQKKSQ